MGAPLGCGGVVLIPAMVSAELLRGTNAEVCLSHLGWVGQWAMDGVRPRLWFPTRSVSRGGSLLGSGWSLGWVIAGLGKQIVLNPELERDESLSLHYSSPFEKIS